MGKREILKLHMKNQNIKTGIIAAFVSFAFYLIGIFTGPGLLEELPSQSESSRVFQNKEVGNYVFRIAEEKPGVVLQGFNLLGLTPPKFPEGSYMVEAEVEAWTVDMKPHDEKFGQVIFFEGDKDGFAFKSRRKDRPVSTYRGKTCYFFYLPSGTNCSSSIESNDGIIWFHIGACTYKSPANSIIYINSDDKGIVIGVAQQEEIGKGKDCKCT